MSNIEKWGNHKIQIEILTPVIINSGDYYEYGELLFDKGQLFKINVNNLIKIMNDSNRNEYIDFVTKGLSTRDDKYHKSVNSIVLDTIKENPDKKNLIFSRPIGVLPSGDTFLKEKPFQEIEKTCIKKINDKPYIPGSSLKGALRTAIIQSILNSSNFNREDYVNPYNNRYIKTKTFESKIMKVKENPKYDPFKYIKVSDFEFDDFKSKNYVGEVQISTKGKPLSVYTTMTESACFNNNKVTLSGTISISSKLELNKLLTKFNQIQNILDVVNDFYIDNFNNKASKLPVATKNSMQKLISDNLTQGKGLIKLGRFSGIENTTYNIVQDQSINIKNHNENINIEGGASFATIERKYLPGYCLLREI